MPTPPFGVARTPEEAKKVQCYKIILNLLQSYIHHKGSKVRLTHTIRIEDRAFIHSTFIVNPHDPS